MKEHLRATTVTKNQFQQALTRIWAAQRSHAIQKIELEILFMQPGDKIKPVEIFSGTPLEAALVKSLLENAEIKLTTRKKEYFQILEKNQQRKGELEKEKTSIKTEYDRLTSESQVHRDTLSPEDTSLYDTLREKRRGIAVATVVDGTCSACGSTLSASLLQSAKMMNQITLCNSCGRILYWGA